MLACSNALGRNKFWNGQPRRHHPSRRLAHQKPIAVAELTNCVAGSERESVPNSVQPDRRFVVGLATLGFLGVVSLDARSASAKTAEKRRDYYQELLEARNNAPNTGAPNTGDLTKYQQLKDDSGAPPAAVSKPLSPPPAAAAPVTMAEKEVEVPAAAPVETPAPKAEAPTIPAIAPSPSIPVPTTANSPLLLVGGGVVTIVALAAASSMPSPGGQQKTAAGASAEASPMNDADAAKKRAAEARAWIDAWRAKRT